MKKIALVGLPNVGKSSLFNMLTGLRQKVANFPGITVEAKKAKMSSGPDYELIDLPGLYSLDARTTDERLSKSYIEGNKEKIDLFVLVVDATNYEKSLYLALELKQRNLNFVICLNMIDLSRTRGQVFDLDAWQAAFPNRKVLEVSSRSLEGIDLLEDVIGKQVEQKIIEEETKTEDLFTKSIEIKDILVKKTIRPDSLTDYLDSIFLHPVLGYVIMFATLFLTFQLLFIGADPFIGYIEEFFEWIGSVVSAFIPDGVFRSLVIDGVIAGVGGFVVFLPHIIMLFVLIHLLESFGYMSRVAFLLDYFMRRVGLPGKAVVPLLSSHACAIPGIMSARIIKDDKQRFLTMMISPLMTCSARLPVYTLLISALVSGESLWMGFDARGVIMFLLYGLAIVISIIVSYFFKKTKMKNSINHLLMELPSYKLPSFKSVMMQAWHKSWLFLKKAGSVIFVLSIIIWALMTFPKKQVDLLGVEASYAASIGKTVEPIFKPIGFDWKMTTALIPSFAAREVMVSSMATVLSVKSDDEDEMVSSLSELLRSEYTQATLISLLVWFIFSPQCIATFGVLRRETNSFVMPAFFGLYTLLMAYGFSFIAYRLFI